MGVRRESVCPKRKYDLDILEKTGLVQYALDILEETGLMRTKPVETPMDPNVQLCVDQGELLSNPNSYRRLVEKLNHITITRPDILCS